MSPGNPSRSLPALLPQTLGLFHSDVELDRVFQIRLRRPLLIRRAACRLGSSPRHWPKGCEERNRWQRRKIPRTPARTRSSSMRPSGLRAQIVGATLKAWYGWDCQLSRCSTAAQTVTVEQVALIIPTDTRASGGRETSLTYTLFNHTPRLGYSPVWWGSGIDVVCAAFPQSRSSSVSHFAAEIAMHTRSDRIAVVSMIVSRLLLSNVRPDGRCGHYGSGRIPSWYLGPG